MSLKEAVAHPHNVARNNFVVDNDLIQPAPAPKLNKTPSQVGEIPTFGQHTEQILRQLNLPDEQYAKLKAMAII